MADLVEAEPKPTGRPPKDRRTILDGIFWILRSGAAWRNLSVRFGKWQAVFDHFNIWSKIGTFDAIARCLQGAIVDAEEIDDELWGADGTIVWAGRCAAGAEKRDQESNASLQALGHCHGGFATKIHILCDGQGHPLTAILSPA